jgi:hypothetical protein
MQAKPIKIIYIFVTSDRPDVYINTIGYCIEHYSLRQITLLGIVEDRGQKAKNLQYLATIRDRIQQQLSLLQEDRYLYKDQDDGKWKIKGIDIEPYHRSRYARISEHKIELHTIFYDSLDTEISNLLRVSDGKCLFDVSAILKRYLVDVYTLLLRKGVHDIYTFELQLQHRTYDERELIHNLSLDTKDYDYVQLSKSPYTRGTVIKTEKQERNAESKAKHLDRAVDIAATHYANSVLAIYLLIVIAAFIGITVFIIRGDWNQLEPWTFILFGIPLLSYIISLGVQIVLQRQFSLKPQNIHNWLKKYELGKLHAEFELDGETEAE